MYAGEDFYKLRPEPEMDYVGRLTKNCQPPQPHGRNYCFYLDNTPILAASAGAMAVLEPFIGREVVVRGKKVDDSFGPEIWPSSLCRRPN